MTNHGIEVPSVIGTTRLGHIGQEDLDALLEHVYQKGRDDLVQEAIELIDAKALPVERGRYAEKTGNDDYNQGLDAAMDILGDL